MVGFGFTVIVNTIGAGEEQPPVTEPVTEIVETIGAVPVLVPVNAAKFPDAAAKGRTFVLSLVQSYVALLLLDENVTAVDCVPLAITWLATWLINTPGLTVIVNVLTAL
jgi:hypothetical protein